MWKFVSLVAAVASLARSTNSHWWLHEAANRLAGRESNVLSVAAAVEAWNDLGGESKMTQIYTDSDSFSKAPIGAKQAVLLLAGDLFGGIDTELLPDVMYNRVEKICAWTVTQARLHVRYSSQLLFELSVLRNGSENTQRDIKTQELIRHTPLANFLPLCRPVIKKIPLPLVQSAVQNKVYRSMANAGSGEAVSINSVEAPNNIAPIDTTLLQFLNYSPSELIFAVSRSEVNAVFEVLFHKGAIDSYFVCDGDADLYRLTYPKRIIESTKSIYRGIGRALGLSIALGVSIGVVKFSQRFLDTMFVTTHPTGDVDRELRNGFTDIISLDTWRESKLTVADISQMWMGAGGRRGYRGLMLNDKELKRMIQFPKGVPSSLIEPFMQQVQERPRFLKELLQRALGVSHLTVAGVDAVYPPVTVTFGPEAENALFKILSGDTTYHMLELA